MLFSGTSSPGCPGYTAVKWVVIVVVIIVVVVTYLLAVRVVAVMYVDAVCCYRPSCVFCRSVTLVSPAKTAEPINLSFGFWTQLG